MKEPGSSDNFNGAAGGRAIALPGIAVSDPGIISWKRSRLIFLEIWTQKARRKRLDSPRWKSNLRLGRDYRKVTCLTQPTAGLSPDFAKHFIR